MVFKKFQCWHFDSRGNPLNPPCHQGSNCRFLHPEDEGWPGLKPMEKRTSFAKRDANGLRRRYSDPYQESPLPHKPEFPPAGRSERPSLVSQHDLFARQKLEDGDRMRGSRSHMNTDPIRGRQRDRKRSAERDQRDPNTNPARLYDRRGHLGLKQTPDRLGKSISQKAHSGFETTIKGQEDFTSNAGRRSLPEKSSRLGTASGHAGNTPPNLDEVATLSAIATGLVAPPARALKAHLSFPSDSEERAKQTVALFRELASLSNQVTQATEAQAREDKKLKALTDLSSSIGRLSKATATAVMPPLAEVLLKHAQGKQHLEDILKAMAGVWDEAVDLLVAEVCDVMDNRLGETLKKISEEGERLQKHISANALTTLKRQRSGDASEDGNDHQPSIINSRRDSKWTEGASLQEQKRRRFHEACPSPSLDSKRNVFKPSAEVQPGIQDILNQMKMKIDEQAQFMQKLTKENNELKAALQQGGSTIASPNASLYAT